MHCFVIVHIVTKRITNITGWANVMSTKCACQNSLQINHMYPDAAMNRIHLAEQTEKISRPWSVNRVYEWMRAIATSLSSKLDDSKKKQRLYLATVLPHWFFTFQISSSGKLLFWQHTFLVEHQGHFPHLNIFFGTYQLKHTEIIIYQISWELAVH